MSALKVLTTFIILLSLISCAAKIKKQKSSPGYIGHGAESVSAQDLIKYAPKPLAREKILKIEAMSEIRTPSMGRISSDGKTLFVNWNVTGKTQVWKVPGPMKFPIQMTGGEDATYLSGVTNDGKYIVVSRDSKGDEYPRLYLQSTKGGELKEIFGKTKVKVRYLGQDKAGKNIYYRANDVAPTVFGIYKYNILTQKRQLLFQGKGYWFIADYKETGEMILGRATTNIAREYYLFNELTKAISPIIGQGVTEDYFVAFAHKKGEYLVSTNSLGDFRRLYLLKGDTLTLISKKVNFDLDSFDIDYKRQRILLQFNRRGFYSFKALDAKTLKPIKLPNLGNALHTYFGSTSYNGQYTTIGQSFYNRPRSSFVYDWKNKALVQWTSASSPEIDTKNFRPWTLEYYKASDGVDIPMFVKRPKGCKTKSCPVIVSFHGGPEGQSLPGFSPFAELFVQKGFIYVKPNVRGSDGYGKAWLNADNGPLRLNVLSDIRDCAIHILGKWSFGGVAPKIGVTGGSYGGYATFVAMTIYAGYFDAGVARVGMSNLVSFLKNTAPHRRYLRESEYGYLDKDMEALKKLSPINYIDKIKSPLLIIQGATDPRVPAGEALQFKNALDKAGVTAELILFSDEGHGVRKRKNRTLSKGHTLDFFVKHLL